MKRPFSRRLSLVVSATRAPGVGSFKDGGGHLSDMDVTSLESEMQTARKGCQNFHIFNFGRLIKFERITTEALLVHEFPYSTLVPRRPAIREKQLLSF